MKRNIQTQEQRISVEVEETDADTQRLFWLSVVMQGLSDALSQSQNQPFKKRREEALKWFEAEEGENSDLAMVCNLAEIDFKKTQERMRMFINKEIPAVDFRCLRKGYTPEPKSQNRANYFKRLRKQDEIKTLKMNNFSRPHFLDNHLNRAAS